MSYIKWIPMPESRKPSRWHWFPWALTLAMGVVVAVNMGMVYAAIHSFPGKAGNDDFALSNRYNQVLEAAQRDAGLGWTMRADLDAAGRPVVVLIDGTGAPLTGATLAGTAERPLGETRQHRLVFHEMSAGRYAAADALPMVGQWDLTLSASARGHEISTTRRIFVH